MEWLRQEWTAQGSSNSVVLILGGLNSIGFLGAISMASSLRAQGYSIVILMKGVFTIRVDHRIPVFGCHNGNMADNDDIKERMRQALEAKNAKSVKSTPSGTAPTEGNTHEHVDREGGKREFRRKSGSS